METKPANKHVKPVPDSTDAYARLREITDPAQAGTLKPWSPAVIDLLKNYGVVTSRKTGVNVQVTLSFPKLTANRAMVIGVRTAKDDGSFAEDLFKFEENVGLIRYYRGSQEEAMPEYTGSHHAPLPISEYLPEVQRDLAAMQRQIKDLAVSTGVELITDEQYQAEIKQIEHDFHAAVFSFRKLHGNSSAVNAMAMAAQHEANKKRSALMAKKQASDRVYKQVSQVPAPEISAAINAQANSGRFDVRLTNHSGQALVVEEVDIAGVKTPLGQMFRNLYPIAHVNIPDRIFDDQMEGIYVTIRYRTLDGKFYEFTHQGVQKYRVGDHRYNIEFPAAPSIKAV